ncbi:MAG: diphosphomevalonate decarboxylase, partial [Bacteroidota bacterium]
MPDQEFVPSNDLQYPNGGKIGFKAPSNIALVKYWGKKPGQIPANPSISFTLNACATRTTMHFEKRKLPEASFSFDFLFEGSPKPDFKPKIRLFLERIVAYLPFLNKYHFVIDSTNSFPHSSGIASSASGMAALALCLLELEQQANPEMTEAYFLRKASFLARLGSGSASRSIEGDLIQWGHTPSILKSTDLYAIRYPHAVHTVFEGYLDTILLIHKGQKSVSSSVGHGLMEGHPYAQNRFTQAHDHLKQLQPIFKNGDLEAFMGIVESEALTLHAMMMASRPYFVLMLPNTLAVIDKIWQFRKETKIPICFTLDAG